MYTPPRHRPGDTLTPADPDALAHIELEFLFDLTDEGFCIVEVLFDGAGNAADYRFLRINPAFASQTGLEDAIGRTAREMLPALEPHWFELYGYVARTGEPIRFAAPSREMGRAFDVHAFRVDAPELHRVAILFTDVTRTAAVAPQARARGLSLDVASCASDLRARADREKLRQVLVNLMSNAVKFTDEGGEVQLTCDADGPEVRIRVRDTGIGIPADRLDSIFEPFVQVRNDLTRTAEGTGLGLAISHDPAVGMGGDLTVESTMGKGSTFTLVLPRA